MGAAAAAAGGGGDVGYVPAGSIVVNGTDEYLDRTPTGAGNRQKYSFSCWTKITNNNTSNGYLIDAGPIAGNGEGIRYTGSSSTPLLITGAGGVGHSNRVTSAIYRDITAWNHVFYIKDTTNSNPSSRLRLFVNGEEVTDFSATQNPPLNDALGNMNNTNTHRLGGNAGQATPSQLYSGYYSEVILLDGYVALPTDFGKYNSNNVWVPIDPTTVVTAGKGTNGFWLDFADSSDLGNDVSGNNNDFTPANMGTANSVLDRPADNAATNVGNYPTWSAINKDSNVTLSSGNTVAEQDSTASFKSVFATQVVPSTGKWVWEIKQTVSSFVGDGYATTGIASTDVAPSIGRSGSGTITFDYQSSATKIRKFGGGATEADYATGVSLTNTNFTFQFAIDSDAEELKLFVNNTQEGATLDISSLTKPYKIISQIYSGGNVDHTLVTNSPDFVNNVPSEYKTIYTANLPEPTVKNGENNFLPMIYEGNGEGQRIGNFIPFTDSHTVANSCLLKSESSQYLSLAKGNLTTPTGGTSSGNQKFTLSFWLKLTKNNNNPADGNGSMIFGTPADSGGGAIQLQWAWNSTQGPAFNWTDWSAVSGGGSNWLRRVLGNATTTAGPQGGRLMLDYSQWHHYVIAADWTSGGGLAGTDACAKIYIDGQLQTLFLYDGSELVKTNPAVTNFSGMMSDITDQNIGWYPTGTRYGCFYIAEVVGVDGQQLAPSVFGETDTSTNRWIPKDPTSTLSSASDFGNNGFYLNMASANDLGNDVSGNGNDWTMNNMDTSGGTNQIDDTPTENFSVLSPSLTNGNGVVSAGNLHFTVTSTSNAAVGSTIGVSSGKFYGEAKYTSGSAYGFGFGLANSDSTVIQSGSGTYLGEVANSWGINASNGNLTNGGSVVVTSYAGGALSNGTTYMWCLDMDNGKWWAGNADTNTWFTNGSVGNPATGANPGIVGLTGTIHICASSYNSDAITMNFGQTTFVNAANIPTGFKSLNQDNLAANTAGITGFSWIKNRDATDDHILQDRVRGIYKYLVSNDTDLEVVNVNSIKRFLQQGVQIGDMDAVNTAAESYVLWQWAANGAGTLNEVGSIDSTVSANTDAGFSVVKYTGTGSAATVGHGLSTAPSVVINKPLGSGSTDPNWQVYHIGVGPTKAIFLNLDIAPATGSGYWNNTAPTSTVFSIGTDRDSATDYINYCFAEVEGYSKFGTYTGNNSSDGPVIHLGFKPAWVMCKRTDTSGNWPINDAIRSPYNPTNLPLFADQTAAAGSGINMDFIANGFKIRDTSVTFNASGGTYIYLAFAEHPFGGDGVGQARAR